MNENNQNINNAQTPENSGMQEPPKQENGRQANVYTVGEWLQEPQKPSEPETTASASAQEEPAAQSTHTAPCGNTYTAPSGNTYTYSAHAPYSAQPGGYYTYNSAPPQPEKKKKGKGGIIALAVAGCLLLSLLMGVGGAIVAWSFLGESEQVELPEESRPNDQVTLPGDTSTDSSSNNAGGAEAPQNVTIKKGGTTVVTTKGDLGDEDLSYADVVALVENSVVEITTNYVVSGSMFSQYVSSGAGSGVIFAQTDKTGYIVTNNHVIEGATSIMVRLKDGTELEATLIGADSMTDLAVLSVISEKELTTAELIEDSNTLVVGQEVIAIGNPLGQLGGTVTNGIVSALEREVTIDGETMKLLQTNAAVNPGNSGGGLFDMRGYLIGVVNAKSSGDDVEGLGFAIPANTVYEIITELIENGYVRGRAALGITVNIARQQYFMQTYTYIYVTDPGKTALQVNDILYAIEGKEISSSDDISSAINGKSVGDKVEIVVIRNNKEVTVEVELIEYVPQTVQ